MAIYFNVAPRYTPGSPAMVSQEVAEQVAREEKHFIEHAKEGAWGEMQKARAERLGLRGIVESIRETRKGWDVHDLITGERFLRLFPEQLRKSGWRQYPDLDGWEKALVDANPPALENYQTKSWFKVEPLWTSGFFDSNKVTCYEPVKQAS